MIVDVLYTHFQIWKSCYGMVDIGFNFQKGCVAIRDFVHVLTSGISI